MPINPPERVIPDPENDAINTSPAEKFKLIFSEKNVPPEEEINV
jgi:hypothetical protein